MTRVLAPVFAFMFFVPPFFPSFIMFAAVTVPGYSLIPQDAVLALLTTTGMLALYGIAILLRPPRQAPPMLLPLLTWLGAGLLAALLGFNPLGGLLFIGIFGLGIVWHLALVRYYAHPGVTRAIFWSYLLSGALASLAAIVMVATRVPANQYTIAHGRAIGTFILPGELAGYLILFLPIAFAVGRLTRNVWLRALAWCAVGLGSIALLLSFSRAGWVGLAAAVAFYVFVSGAVRRRYAPLIVLAGVVAVLAVFNAHHNPAENYTRLSIWDAAIEIVRRFPLTGVGVFNFARIYALVRLPDGDLTAFHAHSFLLTIFAETGVVGLAAVLWTWWRFARELRDRLRGANPAHAVLALAVAAGLAGSLVQGLIDTVSVAIFGLWLPSMALALAAATDGLGNLD